MKKTITLLYTTDNWHTNDSRCLHGIFSDRETALKAIDELIVKVDDVVCYPPLSEEDRELFLRIGQTQGYAGAGEWFSQSPPINEIYCWL